MRHVITLSTIPPRFDKIGRALQSLVRQSSRPEAVELYIPTAYRRFPQWGGGLPQVPDGVTIVRAAEDLGPATKILPAVKARRGQDVDLIYVDDDRIFAPDWAERCLAVRKNRPGVAICGAGFNIRRYGYQWLDGPSPEAVRASDRHFQIGVRVNRVLRFFGVKSAVELEAPWRRFLRSGHVDIAEGCGGVMVRPEFLVDRAFNLPPVVWAVDDIWLSGMLTWRGVPIWADKELFDVREVMETSRHYPMYKAVIEGAGRVAANRACIEYMQQTYGIWGGDATIST